MSKKLEVQSLLETIEKDKKSKKKEEPKKPAPKKEEKPKEEKPKPEVKKEEVKPKKKKVSLGGLFGGKAKAEPKAVPKPDVLPPKSDKVAFTAEKRDPKPVDVKFDTGKSKFDFSEEAPYGKKVFMIYGEKGKGKTYLAFTLTGKIACISFDHQSALIKEQHFKNDKRIKVYDAIKYIDESSPERWLESSVTTFNYINELIENVIKPWEPDWIIIDGYHIYHTIAEMVMRSRNNLMPFQGISNLNVWKERRMYIWQLHNNSIHAAKKGLVYTTYTNVEEIVQDGELITKKEVPRWIDIIMHNTNTVIKASSGQDKDNTRRFYATVESSKITAIPTGGKVDVTDSGFKSLAKGEL